MEFELIPHPNHLPTIDISVRTLVERQGRSGLCFQYVVDGQVGLIDYGSIDEGGRTDGLWKHTCFEAFLGRIGHRQYLELNFINRRWASYHFDDYREGMRDAPIEAIASSFGEIYACNLQNAQVELSPLYPEFEGALELALSAIIEETNGHKSYWALAHPKGPPDFHDRSCFLARLPE